MTTLLNTAYPPSYKNFCFCFVFVGSFVVALFVVVVVLTGGNRVGTRHFSAVN